MKKIALFNATVVLFLVASAWAQMSGGAAAPTSQQVNAIYPDMEEFYIDLHRNPELAFHEQRTAAKLAERVKALGYDVTTGVGGTGIVAILKNGAGPTAMLRTELDALPIEEKTGLPFASTAKGLLKNSPSKHLVKAPTQPPRSLHCWCYISMAQID